MVMRYIEIIENIPQPGESSGKGSKIGADAVVRTKQMTVSEIINTIPGVPYYDDVIDDFDAKDDSWPVFKKVFEYATYLKNNKHSVKDLPPLVVINNKFDDGAHRTSAIWLLQNRLDTKNADFWSNVKLNVKFVEQK